MNYHVIISNPKTGWKFDYWAYENGVIEAEEYVCHIAGFASAREAREAGYEIIAELPPL